MPFSRNMEFTFTTTCLTWIATDNVRALASKAKRSRTYE
jgi:hypothetical protein